MTNHTKASYESIEVFDTFNRYPDKVREKLLSLRQLIFETAADIDLEDLEETLKWGEPSYVTKKGSTIRIAWRKSFPDEVGIFFHCKTTLVDTFKEIYRDQFRFEGNRAILFKLDDKIPADALKHCIALSLTYHKIKHLPMLGI
jgi:hypothetical protein